MRSCLRTPYLSLLFVFVSLAPAVFAQGAKPGANGAAAEVAALLAGFELPATGTALLDDGRTETMIALAARMRINVFELLDASYRYLAPLGFRISIPGSSLRKTEALYDFGRERVRALLPVDVIERIEIGAVRNPEQKAMDVWLSEPREEFIEIGTAVYQTRFGFEKLSPLRFDRSYGVTVKRFFFSTVLERLELYEPGKGAIYVKGLSRPKKWNLWIVTPQKK